MQVAHTDDGFNAFRGFDQFEFRATDAPGGAHGALQVRSSTTTAYLAPTTSIGTYSVASSQSPTSVVAGDALYDLFFSRVDYFLWKRDTWETCDAAAAKVSTGKTSGSLAPLCDRYLPDDSPGALRKPRYRNAAAEAASPTPRVPSPDRK